MSDYFNARLKTTSMSNVIQDCFCFAPLKYMTGSESLRYPLIQSDAGLKTNLKLVNHVLPCFRQIACYDLESSLAKDDVNVWAD